jgi:hypothetical protein
MIVFSLCYSVNQVAKTLEDMIEANQRIPGSIANALLDRFRRQMPKPKPKKVT